MVYRVETRAAFTLVGRSVLVKDAEGNNADMAALWSRSNSEGLLARLSQLDTNHKVYGACFPVDKDNQTFRYAVTAITDNAAAIPDGLEKYTVEAGRWAIFSAKGKIPDVLKPLWNGILSEWLPSQDYEIDPGRPDMENYLEDGAEIWLPVR